ncbi:Rsc4p KNAG_0A06900 [Huiozyma naganishii CBS 8797]|uniref:Bromo domain-containing protein n=1 Tax=Huiozyma naganishii (strain ATCC MYA-139 / BCRC 22969 / CBS 8797 / KCTC 17520 / NBRC 10181 / NCYC 3082 / Yp74L-3) TaxID=1071383 RepID=J7S2T6_HUIN7|nr:hypothetical protein KNAG_0A06900 [Kazachstania naganishii CBS 8797]CCK68344.1 hypothetical protein KNAG_0A06900 [Kazachstania naganishii CBS 8797]
MPHTYMDDENSANAGEQARYMAGKNPRHYNFPPVIYNEALRPKSELYRDPDWSIPKFDLFVTYTLENLMDKYRVLFKDFFKLPSRKFHPQYYYKIEQPISLKEIMSRDYEYAGGSRIFLLDIELLAKNCHAYNEDDSLIVKNAYQMVNYIKYEMLRAKNISKDYMISGKIKTKLQEVWQRIADAREPEILKVLKYNETDGRDYKLSEPFMDRVDEEELAEYYEVIHRPMALNVVKKNLDEGKYSTLYDFILDLYLTFDNAMIFNDKGTPIYESALLLWEFTQVLINDKLFPELKEAQERGELDLEYNKFEFSRNARKRALAIDADVPGEEHPSDTEPAHKGAITANDDDEDDDDDDDDETKHEPIATATSEETKDGDNVKVDEEEEVQERDDEEAKLSNVEGLGNGYTRTLLPDDYLLPSNSKLRNPNSNKRIKLNVMATETPRPDLPIFNIVKSLKREPTSDSYSTEKKVFKVIGEISVYTASSMYQQAMNPLPGSRPPCVQDWAQYDFNMKGLNQTENTYSFAVQPMQTFLTVVTKLNDVVTKSNLTVNNENIPSAKSQLPISSSLMDNSQNPNGTSGNNTDKYEIILNEGINHIKFDCQHTTHGGESVNIWVNVLP